MSKPIQIERGIKYRDADKMALIPVKNVVTEREEILRKPDWMKIRLPADSTRIQGIKAAMRKMACTLFVKRPLALTYLNVLITVQPLL